MKLDDAGAVVFGGGSGLGAATVRQLVRHGARVVIADIRSTAAEELAAELGDRALAYTADVTDERSVHGAVELAASAPRGLRVCVSCAGLLGPRKLFSREGPNPSEDFARVVEVNLIGAINVVRLCAFSMTRNPVEEGERGVCVQTSSVAAYDGQVGQVAYAASKAGVAGMTLPLARELAAHGIRVVAIAPGMFDTPMLSGLPEHARAALAASVPFPARLGDPSEYASLVLHIIQNAMLNGEVIRLDAGLRMASQ